MPIFKVCSGTLIARSLVGSKEKQLEAIHEQQRLLDREPQGQGD